MNAAIEGVRADRDALLGICADLGPADWAAATGCEGWSVKDLLSHLGLTFWALVDNAMKLPVRAGMPTEAAAEFLVRSRRRWNAEAVVADYAQVSDVALRRLAEMAEVDRVTSAGDMGIYPMSAAPLAYSFDHFTHIRADLFRPRGPLAGPAPPSDNLRLGSVLDWIAAALPQQNAAAAEACRFELQVTGPGARIISFGTGQAMATVISDAFSFIRWVTQRGSWKELGVQAAGDKPALAAARNLKVF